MDIKTILFMLALANLVFGLELILFQLREQSSPRNPYWIAAKLLQCVGWLVLSGRGTIPDYLYIPVGNGAILCGLAYECWAMFQISGRRVGRTRHGAAAAGIVLVCILFTPLPSPHRIVITCIIAAVIFALAGWAMLRGPGHKSLLRKYLGWNMWLMVLIQSARVLWVLFAPAGINLFTANLVQTITFGAYFYIVLTNGFGMLLLTREASDRELHRVLGEQRAILDAFPSGLCILRDRLIARCNPAMDAMFGFAPGTLAGRSTRCLYENAQAYAEYGRRVSDEIGQSGRFTGEIPFMRQNGERFWGKVKGTPLFPGPSREYEVFSITDITQEIQYQEALAEARDQAQTANRAKSEFLANMSHEIRTPLNAILGFSQVLERDPALNAAQRDSLHGILRSGEHLLTLINDVLDMAKIEAGRMTPIVAPFDLPALVTETQAVFEPRARERGLVLTVVAPAGPRLVLGDALRLRQVLINLIGNAIKFTPAGGVTLAVEAGAGDRIRFSVSDTGVGIAPAEQVRVFEPFTQCDTGRRVPGGTGLGLALCRQFVELMGGRLTLESQPGQGSCLSFALSLPFAPPQEPLALQSEGPIIGLEPGQPVRRVLIVDDLADNRQPLRALLGTLNPHPPVLELLEASDGRAAQLGDFGRITALLEALRETDPVLCAALAKWAYEYDLEAFTGALAGGGRPARRTGETPVPPRLP